MNPIVRLSLPLSFLVAICPLLACVGEIAGSDSTGAGGARATGAGGALATGQTVGTPPGGGTGPGGPSTTPTPVTDGLPCDVQAFLRASCTTCHGSTPLAGAPMPLVTYADLTAPDRINPGMTTAQAAVARMRNNTAPMPPAPAARAATADITMMQSWIDAAYPTGSCGGPGGGGGSGGPDGGAPSAAGGTTGSGGAMGATGGSGANGGAGGGTAANSLPCDVQALLANRCQTCHGRVPSSGAPMPLVTYADLAAPARSNPSMSYAQLSLARMQNSTSPMPPAPGARATAAEIATMSAWVNGGFPPTACGSSGAGGAGGAGGQTGGGTGGAPASDPFSAAATCTSRMTWTGGEGSTMRPGDACINCHKSNSEAPRFSIAGTVYPTAHEPTLCDGASGSNGARVVIIGADGNSTSLTPNSAGNFTFTGTIALPFQAKVVYMGRERIMTTPQTSGDCNGCHTQFGAMSAPGRILLP